MLWLSDTLLLLPVVVVVVCLSVHMDVPISTALLPGASDSRQCGVVSFSLGVPSVSTHHRLVVCFAPLRTSHVCLLLCVSVCVWGGGALISGTADVDECETHSGAPVFQSHLGPSLSLYRLCVCLSVCVFVCVHVLLGIAGL